LILNFVEIGQTLTKKAGFEAVENVGSHQWRGRPGMKTVIGQMMTCDPEQRLSCLEILHKVIGEYSLR
jgi:hypothetical protein